MNPIDIAAEFGAAVSGEDEIGVVLRAHIHIEAGLIDFLSAVAPFPDLMPRLTYDQRLRICCALGMPPDHFEALRAVGQLRNVFA